MITLAPQSHRDRTPGRSKCPCRHTWFNRIKHCALVLLAGSLLNACGILSEVPDGLHNYPPDFQQFLNDNHAHAEYEEFVYFLQSHGVHQIVPAWQLLQQGSDFRKHDMARYALPERTNWNEMVDTLVFLKHDLIPLIGPVRVLSGFRTPEYNRVAGGARRSRHMSFSALDLRPVAEMNRTKLHRILQNRWHTLGEDYDLGLGLYSSLRFHVDTGGHRQW